VWIAKEELRTLLSTVHAGRSGGEDHAVGDQSGVWDAVLFNGFVLDTAWMMVLVARDRERVAGVVAEPAQELGVGAIGQAPVGEVGLPALVGVFGLATDVGGFRPCGGWVR
jgi:hypothetical protein